MNDDLRRAATPTLPPRQGGPAPVPTSHLPRPGASHRRDGQRLIVLTFLVFMATLPLEWVTIAGAGAGVIKPFHVSALGLMGLCLLRWHPRTLLRPVVRQHVAIYGAYLVALATMAAGGLAFTDPYLPEDAIARQAFYATASVFIAGFIALVVGRRVQRWVAATGLITVGVLVLAIVGALASQHVNVLRTLGDALRQQDPDLISYRLLRSAFRSNADLEEVGANLRHKVFLGMLLAAFLGLACTRIIPQRRRVVRGALTLGSVLGFGLVVLSLSRSTIVCLVIPLLIFPMRIIVRKRARSTHAASVTVAAALTVAVALSPVGELLYTRFMTSASYDSRLSVTGPSFYGQFVDAALVGTESAKVAQSPHNLVLNSWLAGGILAALAAAVMLVAFARVWAREVRRYITGGRGWLLPVNELWVIGIGVIPLVRSVTAGNQFHMVEWTAVGLFLGVVLANERVAAAANALPPSAPPAVPRFGNGTSGGDGATAVVASAPFSGPAVGGGTATWRAPGLRRSAPQ